MIDVYCKNYLAKAGENYELYQELVKLDKFEAWQITTIFYTPRALPIRNARKLANGYRA